DNPADVSHLSWIGLHGNTYDNSWKSACVNGHLPTRHAVSAITLQVEAVRAKMGMMFAPCAMFRDYPEVVRVPGEALHHYLDLWVLTHKDLRLSARMRILREILAEELSQLRPYFDSCCDGEEGVAKTQQA
ncbi:MAG: LysR substrate-binding domain-containing protein, partial [Congregibacter sp.]|nr:LysR substrate-binding domain-containing protein [Congregibacter sp.]